MRTKDFYAKSTDVKQPANPLGQEMAAEIKNKVHPLTLWIKIGHTNAVAASATAVVDSADACYGLATAGLVRCVIIRLGHRPGSV